MDKILTVIALVVVVVLVSALFIKLGWWLFAVPVFNLPSLTIMQAIGLSILLNGSSGIQYSKS